MAVMAFVADAGRQASFKFVGLAAVRKIWRTMCVSINGFSDLDLWPFDLETGMRVASKVGNRPFRFGTLGLWLLELFAMYATNGRTDKSNAFPTGRGITILFENGYRIDRKWHHAVTFWKKLTKIYRVAREKWTISFHCLQRVYHIHTENFYNIYLQYLKH